MSLAERIMLIFVFARAEVKLYKLQHLHNVLHSQEMGRELKFNYIQMWFCCFTFEHRENFDETSLSRASVYSYLKEENYSCLLDDVGKVTSECS